MPSTDIVSSLLLRSTVIKVLNPGLIFIINRLRLFALLITSSSELISAIISSAVSSSKSNCCFNASTISSILYR